MRVLHLMAGAKVGGAETFFSRLIIGLEKSDIEQRVILRPSTPRETMFKKSSVEFCTARFGNVLDFETRRRLKQELDSFSPDIVISWMNRPTKFVPKNKKGEKRTFIHLGSPRGYYSPKYYRDCDHLVVTTKDLAKFYANGSRLPGDISIIPNFVPDFVSEPVSRSKYDTPEDVPLLLALGRLHVNKGFDLLLKAMRFLPDHFLWIGGEGPLESKLKDMAKEFGVSQRVRFLGWVADSGPLYSAADVFVCSSRHEPFGNIIIESWANSTAIVAIASEGPGSIIDHGKTGLLVPSEDSSALAEAIKELYLKPHYRQELAVEGRIRYQESFTEDRVIGQYLDLFERLKN
ncbi:MAG: glycosyltransferase [Pseudomonadota bacterium]|nr:glycosyltransferase [Pseudomonadota bacterium]